MFKHYLPNKNERATVAPKSKFTQLNKGLDIKEQSSSQCFRVITIYLFALQLQERPGVE